MKGRQRKKEKDIEKERMKERKNEKNERKKKGRQKQTQKKKQKEKRKESVGNDRIMAFPSPTYFFRMKSISDVSAFLDTFRSTLVAMIMVVAMGKTVVAAAVRKRERQHVERYEI